MRALVLLLFLSSVLVSTTADNVISTLHPPAGAPVAPLFQTRPDLESLQQRMIDAFDHGRFSETAQLLQYLKEAAPARYNRLPYAMLQARASMQSGDLGSARDLYVSLSQDPRFSRYAMLPLARIAAKRGKPADAMRNYSLYLSHPEYPTYPVVALEALHYCAGQNRPDDLLTLSQLVSRSGSIPRLASYYTAKAYLMKGELITARRLLQDLIRTPKGDDASSLALIDLDTLEGPSLTPGELTSRGRMAYVLWNFDLARKYLQPVALQDIKNSYYLARALSFLGDHEGAKAVFERAIELWPKDPMTRLCREQYANLCLKDGEQEKAQQLLHQQLRVSDNSNYRLIQMLRAQSKFEEALHVLQPFISSRDRSNQARAVFLRGRIYYQKGMNREALADLDWLLQRKPKTLDLREIEYWKALILEKMKHNDDALVLYSSLSARPDFFGSLAREKLGLTEKTSLAENHLCALPVEAEDEIVNRYRAGQDGPALLYLHLYDEFAQSLTTSGMNQFLGLAGEPRSVRLLEMAHIAGLARDYPSANYYSELFVKAVPGALAGISADTLRILFPWAYRETIEKFSQEHAVDPLLVLSIMRQESRFKPMARSEVFARGLMQLIPSTAGSVALSLGLKDFSQEQLYLPEVNVNLGTRYIHQISGEFGNRIDVLAAAYNGGEGNTRVWLAATSSPDPIEFFSNIDFAQTRDYVKQVHVNYERYREIYGDQFAAKSSATAAR